MWKTVRLYQRLYAFSNRTGSTPTLQRIPSAEEREVGEPGGGRASHREAGAIGQEPTSVLEPLFCSLRVIFHSLQGFARACHSRISKRVSLLRVAECCTALRSRWYQ